MTAGVIVDDAQRLLDAIAGDQPITFQTFDESARKRGSLTTVLHGKLAQHRADLTRRNQDGAGVFFMVNAGDGGGRRGANVTAVRAVFVDLDGAPLELVLEGPLLPHATVESSPGRYHAYWFVEGVARADFMALQASIAQRFNGDPKVKDLPRVMRLPGFLHQKKSAAFQSRLLSLARHARYTREEVAAAFGMELQTPEPPAIRSVALADTIPEGERNSTLFGLARGLVNKGLEASEVNARIQRVNASRCKPPLCASEVDALVASACSHGPAGYLNLPLVVFDSEAYRQLSHAARTVVAMAYRRYNGSNNGNIALPYSEFRREFSRSETFYRARAEAVASGLVTLSRKRRYHERGGREPDLYTVAMTPPSGVNHVRQAVN